MSDTDNDAETTVDSAIEGVDAQTHKPVGKFTRLLSLILYAQNCQITEAVWFAVATFQAGTRLLTDKRGDRVNEFT